MPMALIPEAAAIGIVAGAFVAVAGALGIIVRAARRAKKLADERQDGWDWVRRQMEENGASLSAGTDGKSVRGVLDSLVISMSRLEVNQREQGQRIAGIGQSLDDHLLEAGEALQRFDDHVAQHNRDDG